MERIENPVLRAVRQLAASVFESVEQADAWLEEPNAVFDGRPPIVTLETVEGHRAVVDELKRIDYSRS